MFAQPHKAKRRNFILNVVFPMSSAGKFVCRFIDGLLRQAAQTGIKITKKQHNQ